MIAVHEMLAVNVVALWLAIAAAAMLALRRRRGEQATAAEQSRQNGLNAPAGDLQLADWQPGA